MAGQAAERGGAGRGGVARAVQVVIMAAQTAITAAAQPAILSLLLLLVGQTAHDQAVIIVGRHRHSIHGNRPVLLRLVDLRLQVAHLQAGGNRVPMSGLYPFVVHDLIDGVLQIPEQAVCGEQDGLVARTLSVLLLRARVLLQFS